MTTLSDLKALVEAARKPWGPVIVTHLMPNGDHPEDGSDADAELATALVNAAPALIAVAAASFRLLEDKNNVHAWEALFQAREALEKSK